MNDRRWRALALGCCTAMAAALAACASAPVVPVRGSAAAVEALAGEWNGTYASGDTGRSGTIWFRLVAGEDHAHGDVMMTARGRQAPYSRNRPPVRPQAGPPQDTPSQFLSIRFVRAARDEIEGTLDPYWDPDCGCQATTAFRGSLAEGRLQGTFVTRLDGGATVSGRWEAVRKQ